MVLCCANCKIVDKEIIFDLTFGSYICRLFYSNGFCSIIAELDKTEWKKRLEAPFIKVQDEVR